MKKSKFRLALLVVPLLLASHLALADGETKKKKTNADSSLSDAVHALQDEVKQLADFQESFVKDISNYEDASWQEIAYLRSVLGELPLSALTGGHVQELDSGKNNIKHMIQYLQALYPPDGITGTPGQAKDGHPIPTTYKETFYNRAKDLYDGIESNSSSINAAAEKTETQIQNNTVNYANTQAQFTTTAQNIVNTALDNANISEKIAQAISAANIPEVAASDVTNALNNAHISALIAQAISAADIQGAATNDLAKALNQANITQEITKAISEANIAGTASSSVSQALAKANISKEIALAISKRVSELEISRVETNNASLNNQPDNSSSNISEVLIKRMKKQNELRAPRDIRGLMEN